MCTGCVDVVAAPWANCQPLVWSAAAPRRSLAAMRKLQPLQVTAALIGALALATSACATAAPRGSAASADPIKIGFVWGVSGAVAEIVRPASEASKAYFDDLNKRGGIKGHPVQMVEIDTKYQVPLAQEGYKKVTTEDHVPLVVLASTGDTSFNILSTWTYTPCVTLPVFTGPSGLPVGIQLIGHRNQDHRLLEGAQAVYWVFSQST